MTLTLSLREDLTFDEFIVGHNAPLVDRLRSAPRVWLYGDHAVGKTHLLHALCHEQPNSLYIYSQESDVIGCESFDLVAIDDVDNFLGDRDSEIELQMLYQNLNFAVSRLVVASNMHPRELSFTVRDLASRFRAFDMLHIQSLEGDRICEFLVRCARRRGIRIPSNVAQYIVDRLDRSQEELLRILDQLDRASLEHHRLITIPFVRNVMGLA